MARTMSLYRRIFRLTPLRISLIIMVAFLVLYSQKEKARKKVEYGYRNQRFQVLELIEKKAFDIRFQLVELLFDTKGAEEIVIAEIDDQAVAHWGWPFPRSRWADFLRRMKEYEVKVVSYDVVFADPGEYLGLRFLKDVTSKYHDLGLGDPPLAELSKKQPVLMNYLERVKSFGEYMDEQAYLADEDRILADALSETENVVLGWYGYRSPTEVEDQPDTDFMDNAALIHTSSIPVQMSKNWDWKKLVDRMGLVRVLGLQTPVRTIGEKAEHFGFFTSIPDTIDGTIRRTPLVMLFSGDPEDPNADNTFFYPSIALEAVALYTGESPLISVDQFGLNVHMQDHVIPTDKYGRLLINWMGPRDTFKYYSVYDIITGFADKPGVDPKEIFKDKIVFVGSTTIGAHDMRTIPFGTAPGVEMHANVAGNIFMENALQRPEWFAAFDMLFIIAVGIIFGILMPRLSALAGGAIALLLFVAYGAMNVYFFVEKQYSFTIVFPLAEILVVYIGITIFRYATEEREKRFIKGAFEQYLSPQVIDVLVKDPSKLKLGGERKELTAFFSDIQSFSTFSERMEPEELVHFLNIYLTEMCDIILRYDGTIDKFEGDAIIAFFGAPVDYEDHARRACLCTVDIQRRMVELREQWAKESWPVVHMRVGLNTGPMVVGNMGSRDRMDYTIMGDAVNLAARLEEAGKQYKVYTMISEYTREEAGDVIEARELDSLRVVGKTEPVRVYEILGAKGEVDEKKKKVAELFEKGRELYLNRDFEAARAVFRQALEVDPSDGPSLVYEARCEDYGENPPGPEWDGVYTMTKK